MDSTQRWHNFIWDEEKIARFWSFISEREPWKDEFFSKQVGVGIVNFLKYFVPLKGRVLDYGCGPGHLLECLLAEGFYCEGVDFSADTVEGANRRFQGHPAWSGAKVSSGKELSCRDGSFDLIICLETMEHILPERMAVLLANFRRVLEPEKGMLFITVPNSENLTGKMAYCPECGSVFHNYQHLTSFDSGSLQKLMTDHGFRTILCDATDFRTFQQRTFPGILDWSPRVLYRWIRSMTDGCKDRINWPATPFGGRRLHRRLGKGIHLFWLGTRNEGSIHHGA